MALIIFIGKKINNNLFIIILYNNFNRYMYYDFAEFYF